MASLPKREYRSNAVMTGSNEPDPPVIVFVNEALVNKQIWDPLVLLMEKQYPRYRFLRYGMLAAIQDSPKVFRPVIDICDLDIRGYSDDSVEQSEDLTIEFLVHDLKDVLAKAGVKQVLSIVGLGLGASIALALIKNIAEFEGPDLVISSFVGISFPIAGSQTASEKAIREIWDDRISLAQRFGMDITGDKAVVHWLSADARDSGGWHQIRNMIAACSSIGMEKQANCAIESVRQGTMYDSRGILASLDIPCLFLCGASDYIYPEEMETYPQVPRAGRGKFVLLDRCSRLAVFERPALVADVMGAWLEESVTNAGPK